MRRRGLDRGHASFSDPYVLTNNNDGSLIIEHESYFSDGTVYDSQEWTSVAGVTVS